MGLCVNKSTKDGLQCFSDELIYSSTYKFKLIYIGCEAL
jgi:hypothetical protein